MIAKCHRCGKERYIYNPKKEVKLCKACYMYSTRDPEKFKVYQKRWRDKNPNYFNEYYHKNKEQFKRRYREQREKKNEN